jgi:phosphoglycolate phosphatase
MTVDTLLFDLDGTLVDSARDLATALNLLRGELGLAPLPLDRVRACVGDGATLLVKRAMAEIPYDDELLRRFLTLYGEHLLDETTVYPGIRAFLDRQHRRKLGIVTNKPAAFTRPLLDGLDLSRYFAVVVGGDTCPEKKPHPEPLRHALRQLGADPATAVMIGDHHTDLRAGAAAGLRTCFCAWGLGDHGDSPYDDLAATPADLPRLYPGDPP